MRMFRVLVVAAVMVLVVGCRLPGAPTPGAACAATDKSECETDRTLALCVAGAWLEYPCEGRCGNAQTPHCVLDATPGTSCPAAWEGTGSCRTRAPNRVSMCRGGKWADCACDTCFSTGIGINCGGASADARSLVCS